MELRRDLEPSIRADLEKKMVFVAGPRQVGKTTLARRILALADAGIYLDWDNRDDRIEIRAGRWPGGQALVVLDEIHKWRSWKSWLKGEFDKHGDRLRFLVTGSARLDVYRRGSDSLQGRYHHYRLHPFTYAEIVSGGSPVHLQPGNELPIPVSAPREPLENLLQFGGFPEPFIAQSARALRRWRKERLDRFFREDVRDLEAVRDLASIQILADLLPERVGSLLSLNSLREDLEVSHRAVTHWIEILERLYCVFRLRPYAASRAHSLRKMTKTYMWDTSLVENQAGRFENLVASHLLKLAHSLQDREGWGADLWYLRDRSGREVDFLVTVDRQPWFAVEAKTSETRIDPALVRFREVLRIPWVYQVVLEGERDFVESGVRCLPAHRFLAALA